MNLAYFITPHGFGHAARAAAVMEAVHARRPDAHFHIFTEAPKWFFRESLAGPFTYHALATDVGLAQTSPLHADLDETVRRLSALLPFDGGLVADLARQLQALDCRRVLCDIAALGIAAAAAAGLPSVLIENFTWDWIYAGYFDAAPALRGYAEYFARLNARADFHIQTAPLCAPSPRAALTTAPAARRRRQTRAAIRAQLGVAEATPLALLTMGGIAPQYAFLDALRRLQDVVFVAPGAGPDWERHGNLIRLPHHSPLYHPDLVAASDAVVGKLGYSTLAEVFHAGVPYGFLRRPGFRESDELAHYAAAHLPGVEVAAEAFEAGAWETFLPPLLAQPRRTVTAPNGADQIAAFILEQGRA